MVTNIKSANPPWHMLYKAGGVVSIILGALFLVSIANLWVSLFQDNWLIKLFKLNAGFSGISFDAMTGVNPLDVSILALAAIVHLSLFAALRPTSKIWSVVAVVQPFLAIALFLITALVGRSAVMGAGLVISCVMLRSNIFSKTIAFTGILASVLLLIGDFGTTPNSHSSALAILIGIGYVLLVIWFFLVGQRFFRFGISLKTKNP